VRREPGELKHQRKARGKRKSSRETNGRSLEEHLEANDTDFRKQQTILVEWMLRRGEDSIGKGNNLTTIK